MNEDIEQVIRVGLSARLRDVRNDLGISQKALSQLAGIPANQISGYETGKWIPQLPSLRRLALALNTSVSQLLQGVC